MIRKFECEPAPLMFGFVLGPMIEENLRRAMVLSDGDFHVFSRPISLTLLIVAATLVVITALPAIRRCRDKILQED
jgi:putative tricarboxylic transport membrane protein